MGAATMTAQRKILAATGLSARCDRLKETQANLVVFGTHSRSCFAHATVGSMAEWILSWANVDSLKVRLVHRHYARLGTAVTDAITSLRNRGSSICWAFSSRIFAAASS